MAGAKKSYTIHLGRISETETDIELFPDPKKVFKKWNKTLAERVLPVLSFDLGLLNRKGRAVFLYYGDTAVDFLEWKTDGERIVSVSDDVKTLEPFADPVDVRATCASLGGRYLALDTYEIRRTQPSALAPRGWPAFLQKELSAKGAQDPLMRPRIGQHYPCLVQATSLTGRADLSDEDDLIDAELPTDFLDLAPMLFYLTVDGREFIQQMQMT